MRLLLFLTTVLISIIISQLPAQDLADARSLAMAGSNIAITEGAEHIGGNPATLAVRRDFNFELQLVSARLMIKNNSLSIKDYDRYFTTGDSLTQQDIDYLFGNIPEEGLAGDFNFGVRTLAFYTYPFSITLAGVGDGYTNIPKDPLEIPFYGNVENKAYNMDDMDGEAWAGATINVGFAYPISQWIPTNFDFLSAGIAAKYIRGIEYAKIENASGRFITTDQYILADSKLDIKQSHGGSGYGIDLGVLGIYEEHWTFSFHIKNILGGVRWNKDNEIQHSSVYSDTIRVNDLDKLTHTEIDTTYPADVFTTQLPRVANFAVALQYMPNLVITASWRQGLNKTLGNTIKPAISAGVEYKPIPQIPLRGGITVGGDNAFGLGLGIGFDLKYWQLNLGYLNHNFRWFRNARSVDLALTMQVRF
jgi:hypothetical protein